MLPSYDGVGDEDSFGNDRPISLFGASKVAESHVHAKFDGFPDNMLNSVPGQSGFRKNHSGISA